MFEAKFDSKSEFAVAKIIADTIETKEGDIIYIQLRDSACYNGTKTFLFKVFVNGIY